MKFFYLLFLYCIVIYSSYSQVKIITGHRDYHYGIVSAETDESVTILKPDGFRYIIPLKDITLLNETDSQIKTRDSLSFKAHIYFIDNDSVYYYFGKSRVSHSISRANILVLEYDTGDEPKNEQKFHNSMFKSQSDSTSDNSQYNKEFSGKSYWMFGLTFLCPGGINLLAGKQYGSGYGWRLQAGCMSDLEEIYIIGAQWNFMYNLKKEPNFEHNLSVGLGISTFEMLPYHNTEELFYSGFFYDVNVGGFFLETGIAFVEANISKSFMFLQLGYVYR